MWLNHGLHNVLHNGPTDYWSESVTNEYEVTHPRWEHYPVNDFEIKVNFEAVYGPDFEILNLINPNSVILANGSEITVENKTKIYI